MHGSGQGTDSEKSPRTGVHSHSNRPTRVFLGAFLHSNLPTSRYSIKGNGSCNIIMDPTLLLPTRPVVPNFSALFFRSQHSAMSSHSFSSR